MTRMDSLKTLTDINLDDLAAAFGWPVSAGRRRLMKLFFGAAAEKFAKRMLVLDAQVQAQGLPRAARAALSLYAKDAHLLGGENIPPQGPVLFLANHPGMVDTLAAFTQLGREDLKILALDKPFWHALEHISQHLIFIGPSPAQRMAALRQAAAHLKAGEAVLTFPAGKIDPDPAVYAGAEEALREWSDSIGAFLRLAPQTQALPVLISGVLWPKAVLHPLTRLRPAGSEREKMGASLQLLMHLLFNATPLRVKVQVGAPLQAAPQEMHSALLQAMRGLLAQLSSR